jgi:gamma-glutamylcyclotransferase
MPDDAPTHETIYFAYGSNVWFDQMNRRCPDNKYLGLGLLRDW